MQAPAWTLQGTGLVRLLELARLYYAGFHGQALAAPRAGGPSASELQRRDAVLASLHTRVAQHSESGAITARQTTDVGGMLRSIHAQHALLRDQGMHSPQTAGLTMGPQGVHRFFTRTNTASGWLARSSGWQRPFQAQVQGEDDLSSQKTKPPRQAEAEDEAKKKSKLASDEADAQRLRQASADADSAAPKAQPPAQAPRQAEADEAQPRPQGTGPAAEQDDAARQRAQADEAQPRPQRTGPEADPDDAARQRAQAADEAKKKSKQAADGADSQSQRRGSAEDSGSQSPRQASADDASSQSSKQTSADAGPAGPKTAETDAASKPKTSRTQAGRGQGSVTGYGVGQTTDSSETAVWKEGTVHQGENHQSYAEVAALEARARTFKTELGVGAQAEANLFRASAGVTADTSLAKVGEAEIVGASGYAEAHFSVGARATAEAGAGIGKDGLPALRVGADVYTGALQENRAGGELRLMGIGAGAQGSTTLLAGAQANAETTLGLTGAKVSAGAFAGASAGTSGTASVAGVGVSGSAEAWAGVGARLDADVGYKEGKLNLEFGIGAALGIGGATSVGFTWDINKTVADGKRFVDNVGKLLDAQAAATAKTLESSAKDVGRAATAAASQVEQGLKSVAKSAGSAVKSVASAAKSVGNAIAKGLKGLFG
jgi:hypothetical protein